ncbi:hypothetical protein AUR04nite_25370 [Glutamicibacter uratoxydans]|uniref:Nudix hydrolase domain-containing protein n=1 Tax=Glutamicibacter uratoxydans TaxID=43667 RepID=A0A4Y4DTS9_GLUUR|nr:NUDIX domain-containing protein [Glutamicibacter uratoxydans]GED07005.1 hypothetical protein AUR04nite_25370 [Glutamicibacter uratoxydans]
MTPMPANAPGTRSEKVVCFLVRQRHVLVFTHKGFDLRTTGIQVPAGTVKPGEDPAAAAVRELAEESGIQARVRAFLGSEDYDLFPVRDEVATRHFFWLEAPADALLPGLEQSFLGGEADAADGLDRPFTCFWMPLAQAHVLAAGFSAKLGALARLIAQEEAAAH